MSSIQTALFELGMPTCSLRRFGDSLDRLQKLVGVRIARIDIERVLYGARGFAQLAADGKCTPEHHQSPRIGGQERSRAAGMGHDFADVSTLVEKR